MIGWCTHTRTHMRAHTRRCPGLEEHCLDPLLVVLAKYRSWADLIECIGESYCLLQIPVDDICYLLPVTRYKVSVTCLLLVTLVSDLIECIGDVATSSKRYYVAYHE